MPDETQLDRIESSLISFKGEAQTELRSINKHLASLNGKVASHEQTLHGPRGHGGLVDDVRGLFERMKPAGTVQTRTAVAMMAAIVSAFGVIVALTLAVQ